jgi:hypothetical protein
MSKKIVLPLEDAGEKNCQKEGDGSEGIGRDIQKARLC